MTSEPPMGTAGQERRGAQSSSTFTFADWKSEIVLTVPPVHSCIPNPVSSTSQGPLSPVHPSPDHCHSPWTDGICHLSLHQCTHPSASGPTYLLDPSSTPRSKWPFKHLTLLTSRSGFNSLPLTLG